MVKFTGCYHGHGDSFLIKAGSGAMTHGIPDSAGITPGTSRDTLVAEYNNLDEVRKITTKHRKDIAAIIVEPVVGNMGTVLPLPGFLEGLREIADMEGIVLIFDDGEIVGEILPELRVVGRESIFIPNPLIKENRDLKITVITRKE